jgi:hypothetical protein
VLAYNGAGGSAYSNEACRTVAAPPTTTVSVTASDPTATEAGASPGAFTVSRTGPTTAALTVAYSVAGTASAGGDYTPLSGSVVIPAGAASANVTVTPINDTAIEANETVVLSLTAGAGYTVGAPATATVTIASDDGPPTVTIAATTATASEAGAVVGRFTVTRGGSTSSALTVNLAAAGSATPGTDYVALPSSVTIPAGSVTAIVTVTPINDALVEPNETVVLTVSGSPNYTVGPSGSATVTLVSDDVQQRTLTVAKAGLGSGTVISSPAGISCGSDCTHTYAQGSTVTLTAIADPGSTFSGWTGPICPGSGPCIVTLGGDVAVTAVFARPGTKYPIVTGPGSGSASWVTSFLEPPSPGAMEKTAAFLAYPFFQGGVHVALGDLDGDGTPEIITGAGGGGGPHVRIFRGDGSDFNLGLMAYDPAFTGGVRVAACDVDGDGTGELVTSPGPGGGPHVRIWKKIGNVFSELTGFFAYAPHFTNGVFVACGDLTGDGLAEVVTAADAGGGPHVRIWRVVGDHVVETAGGGFFAYAPTFSGGVRVAAGDVDGDGRAELVTGAGPGGGAHVRVWMLTPTGGVSELFGFLAYAPHFTGGVSVGAGDVDGDGLAEIITGAGPGGGPHVQAFAFVGSVLSVRQSFFAYSPTFTGGVFVAGFESPLP